MKPQPLSKKKSLAMPINFLLGCSDKNLGSFELARLSEVANLRTNLHVILDQLIDQMAQAALTAWFRTIDRETLRQALNNPDDIIAWAREKIRDGQRSEEELIPLTSLPAGAAHLAAAMRYQQRNIAEGKCAICPQPLDRNSVRYCTQHLAKMRARKGPKAKGAPGSADYLYGDGFEDRRGRHPGNLAALEMSREKQTRALLAELGIPPESAAISMKAAIEALLKFMPRSAADAMTQAELFEKAVIPTKTTGQRALRHLLETRQIRRIGQGWKRNPYRYFQGR